MPNVEKIERFLTSIYQNQSGEATPVTRRLTIAARHPVLTWAALRQVTRVPIVDVALSDSDKANARWLYDPRRPWSLPGFVSSYIELPSPLQTYFQGTPKQNLRTRTSQAKLAGYSTRVIEPSQIKDVIAEVFKNKGWEVHAIERDLRKRDLRKPGEPLEGPLCIGVFDPNEHVVGFCLGAQTGNVVRTLWSLSSERGTSRWLCFSRYVEEASARGARYIVESPPWAFTGGNKIFARHVGFSPVRIRSR